MSTYAGTLSRSRLSDPKTVGVVGIAVGVLAFVLAIPPVTLRSAVWPVVMVLTLEVTVAMPLPASVAAMYT